MGGGLAGWVGRGAAFAGFRATAGRLGVFSQNPAGGLESSPAQSVSEREREREKGTSGTHPLPEHQEVQGGGKMSKVGSSELQNSEAFLSLFFGEGVL